MTDNNQKTQLKQSLKPLLKQLLKKGYSEIELIHLRIAPQRILDLAIEEHRSEQRLNHQTLSTQHNQANFAMRLGC